jgi:hypothetical protein
MPFYRSHGLVSVDPECLQRGAHALPDTFQVELAAQDLIVYPEGVDYGSLCPDDIADIGGGIQDNKPFKATKIGGPMGGCLPAQFLDYQVDNESLLSAGAMIGPGGLVIMDDAG